MDLNPSPFAEPPSAPSNPQPVRRGAPTRPPSALASVGWNDLRVKAWAAALTLATAYVATKPEKYGWLAPVLTAWAAASKPPTVTVRGTAATVAAGCLLGLLFAFAPATAQGRVPAWFPWHATYPQIVDDLGQEICWVSPTDSVHDRGPEIAAFIADVVNEAARRGRRP